MEYKSITYRLDLKEMYGIPASRFIAKLIYFTAVNRINNQNIIENKCWVYVEGGYKKITSHSHLPDLSPSQLQRAVAKLEEMEVIEVSKNLNKFRSDRTNRYCLNEKQFGQDILEMIQKLKGKTIEKNDTPKKTTHTQSVPSQPTNKPKPTTKTTKTKKADEPTFEQVEKKVKKLSSKLDSNVNEFDEIGKTTFEDAFLFAFSVAYSNEDWNSSKLKALRTIILKVCDNFFRLKAKYPTKTELMQELEWLFFAAHRNKYIKLDAERFSPYLIRDQITNLLAEAAKWRKRHHNAKDGFRRTYRGNSVTELYKKIS